ncbi:hypothetical protein E4T39_05060 [Aureobasidium subglaciale]|nr:hypothetical protein E4T39_05060 [Aureobasidium subglaciale]
MNTSMGVTHLDKANLPMIDYSRIEAFFSERTPEKLTENVKLLNAVNYIGFIYRKNHDVTHENMKKPFDYNKEFSASKCTSPYIKVTEVEQEQEMKIILILHPIGGLLSRCFDGDLRSIEHRVVGPPPEPLELDAQGRLPPRSSLA